MCDKSQSPGESVLRLRWIDEPALPYPEPQIEVRGPYGFCFLDMGVRDLRYAAEYDGKAWHAEDRQDHDEERRTFIGREEGWIIDIFTDQNVYGRTQNAGELLQAGITTSRRRIGSAAWKGQNRNR